MLFPALQPAGTLASPKAFDNSRVQLLLHQTGLAVQAFPAAGSIRKAF